MPSRGWLYQQALLSAYNAIIKMVGDLIKNIPAGATTTDGWKDLSSNQV